MAENLKRRITRLEAKGGVRRETELSAAFKRARGTALRPRLQEILIDEPDFTDWVPLEERYVSEKV